MSSTLHTVAEWISPDPVMTSVHIFYFLVPPDVSIKCVAVLCLGLLIVKIPAPPLEMISETSKEHKPWDKDLPVVLLI